MPKQDIIQLEAVGEFPFTFYIEKAIAKDTEDELIIEGIASTTNVDHDSERMSKDALRAMEAAINKDGVPLRVEHQKEGDAVIGRVFKGWVDERDQLHIRARLDKNHPVSPILHHSMKNGLKMGLSVGGIVKRAVKEFVESVGGIVKTFYDVALQEVSVTPRPANYDSWLIAKSIAKDPKDAEQYSESMGLRREFLLEHSQLDYLQAFAKSVPDKAWRKVESPIKINKDDKSMKKDEQENTDETTDKAVSRAEFNSLGKAVKTLSQLVSKGFDSMGKIMSKAMDGDAKDATNPDKDKPEGEQETAKMDNDPLEQANPNKDKPDEEEQQAAKSESEDDEETTKDGEDDEEETTKDGEDEETETKSRKKNKTESEDNTYDLETVTRSINKLGKLSKRVARMNKDEDAEDTETEKDGDDEKETETKSRRTRKTETDDEDKETTKDGDDEETETTKNAHPLDVFVVKMTNMMENIVTKMEKSGKRVIGFEKAFIEDLQHNPEVQAEIAKLSKQPGFKKSVAMGVPYMVTKDGRRLPLQVIPEKVEKSKDEQPKDFKTLYKSNYSSVSDPDAN